MVSPGAQRPPATASSSARTRWTLTLLAFGSTSVHSSSEWVRPPGPPRPIVIAGMPRLIGMLASVLLTVVGRRHAERRIAAAAACTIGASIARLTARPLADHLRVRLDRPLPSSSARRSLRPRPRGSSARNCLVDLLQFGARLRSHVHVHADLERDRVDRGAAADDADAVGRLGRGRHLDAREPRDRARHRVRRVHEAERAVTVPAGALERDAIALAADAAVA